MQPIRRQSHLRGLADPGGLAFQGEGLEIRTQSAEMQDGAEAGRLDQIDRSLCALPAPDHHMFRPDAECDRCAVLATIGTAERDPGVVMSDKDLLLGTI